MSPILSRDIVREISPGSKPLLPSLSYYRRIVSAYLIGGQSHLTFWHEIPEENLNANAGELGEYYMVFAEKANYNGVYDAAGIPQLDYRGKIGRQYNPIAIAQYGLGNYNLFRRTGDANRRDNFLRVADWLVLHLEPNPQGTQGLESPLRLGVSRPPAGAMVFRAGAGTGNLASGALPSRVRRLSLSHCRSSSVAKLLQSHVTGKVESHSPTNAMISGSRNM